MSSAVFVSCPHPNSNRTGGARGGSLAGAIRWSALAAVVVAFLAGLDIGTSVVVASMATLIALDTERPIALTNVALVYNFLVFAVGPMLISVQDVARVQRFGAWLAVAALVGVLVGRASRPPSLNIAYTGRNLGPKPYVRSLRLMRATIWLWVVVVLLQIAQTGPSAYLSGVGLAAGIQGYADGGLSATQILSLAVGVISSAAMAVHVSIAYRTPGAKVAWRPLLMLGIGLPVLDLSRSGVLFSTLALLLAWSLVRRTGMTKVTFAGRLVVVMVSFALVFGLSVGIGVMREHALDRDADTRSSILLSEFSPVVVVDYALGPDAPTRYRGASLFLPAVTRFVPRKIFPSKPENTTVQFMRSYDPESYEAGFSLAPTAVGVLLLNFGVTGALAIWAGLMFFTVRLIDRRRTINGYSAGALMVIYSNAFPLLRDDLANSVPQVVVAWLLYSFLRRRMIGSRL